MIGLDTLLWWTCKGTVILGGAAIAAFALRRQPAAVRHAVWTIAVGAQLLVPVAPHFLPAGGLGVAMPPAAKTAITRLGSLRPASPPPNAPLPFPAVANRGPEVQSPGDARPIPGARSLDGVVMILLATGSALHLVRLLLGWLQLARLARSAELVTDEEWLSSTRQLSRSLGLSRPVTLIRSRAIQIPVTWGVRRPKLLLPAASRTWPAHFRRHVLLHELAHVRRRDTLWQLMAQCALIAFWFNPGLRLAVKRLRIEAEHACDDYVLRHGERPSSYAATLVDLVHACVGAPPLALATLSVAQRSDLETRVAAVLSPSRDAGVRRALLWASIAVTFAIALPLAALQPVNARPPAAGSPALTCRPLMIPNCDFAETSGSLTLPDSTTLHYFFLRPESDRWLEASFSLDARFTPDDRALVATPGVQALVRERRGPVDRAVYLDEAGGRLRHRYLVNGRSADWDSDAERWLAHVMPDVIRRTSAGVPERAQRIIARGGVDGLLAEVPRLAVADVRRSYLLELLALPPSELPRAQLISSARRELAADEPTFAAFLTDLIEREGSRGDLRYQVLDEVHTLDRGWSRMIVLQAMLQHPDPRVQLAALESLQLVREQVWRRDLLQASAPHALAASPPLVDAWFTALATLEAPIYRRELGAWIHTLELPSPIASRLVAELG